MAEPTVGALIKQARTGASLTQEALASRIDGLTASDISKAERGALELTQAQLKAIAKATGVTQASLLNAAKAAAAKTEKPAAKKTGTAKKAESAKKTDAKTESAKQAASDTLKLTAAEKKLVQLYRKADADTKKAAVALLEGKEASGGDLLGNLLGGALGMLTGKK